MRIGRVSQANPNYRNMIVGKERLLPRVLVGKGNMRSFFLMFLIFPLLHSTF